MTRARLPDGQERRAATGLRADGRRLEGYAAVFGAPAPIAGFTETVIAGAFRKTLEARADIVALVDHDPGRLLARTASGTLRLTEDAKGLRFDIDVPDTTLGRDILALAERRDLGGCSFTFRAVDERWPSPDRRELRAVDLLEVSIVCAWPAYAQTTVEARQRAAQGDALSRRRFLETL